MTAVPNQTERFDPVRIREQFPALHQDARGCPLVYLDNAATTQKPRAVIDAIRHYYECDNANVHRGVHALSERATLAFEEARVRMQRFLNAEKRHEVIFTRGTTDAINLVAATWGRQNIGPGDEIVLTWMEHHSNIVPWQMLCEQTGATLKVCPINDDGELMLDELEKLVGRRTRLVSCVHVSNALGTINPVEKVVEIAHSVGARVLLDGAQATAHLPVDVQELDCDFYALSAHKMYGPTGIGALYGKEELLEAMPPYQGGGDMILKVTFEKTTYAGLPNRLEAGTPNIAGAIGMGVAAEWLREAGIEAAAAHEDDLLRYGTEKLRAIDGLRLIGTARQKVGVLSFVLDGVHPHDAGTVLDMHGVAVRAGQHCTEPLMARFGVPATTRASMGIYNVREDIDRLVDALHETIKVLR